MGVALAIAQLRAARDRLTRALEITNTLRSGDEERGKELVDLAATADAELCSACEILEVPAPPADLIPGPPRRNEGLLRRWRTNIWLHGRLERVNELLARYKTETTPDGGPYR